MSDPLYGKELLRLAADAHGAGGLAEPHLTGHAHNPVCGDKVTIDLALENGRITAVAQRTKACVLTQASASILGQSLKGAARKDIETLRQTVQRMLEADGGAPLPPFEAFGVLQTASPYPNRHRCVLLPIDAVLAAFDASEASQPKRIGS